MTGILGATLILFFLLLLFAKLLLLSQGIVFQPLFFQVILLLVFEGGIGMSMVLRKLKGPYTSRLISSLKIGKNTPNS